MCQKCLCTAYPFKVPLKIWPKTYVTATHQAWRMCTFQHLIWNFQLKFNEYQKHLARSWLARRTGELQERVDESGFLTKEPEQKVGEIMKMLKITMKWNHIVIFQKCAIFSQF